MVTGTKAGGPPPGEHPRLLFGAHQSGLLAPRFCFLSSTPTEPCDQTGTDFTSQEDGHPTPTPTPHPRLKSPETLCLLFLRLQKGPAQRPLVLIRVKPPSTPVVLSVPSGNDSSWCR